jgi:hypothetical protein
LPVLPVPVFLSKDRAHPDYLHLAADDPLAAAGAERFFR